MPPVSRRTHLPLIACVAFALALRVVLAVSTDLYYDEAYYWTWSRHLALGYYDHPPLIAWLIAALGVRPTALLCGVATLGAVFGFARSVHGTNEAGWRAAALWCAVPASNIAGVIATPDSPLLLAWTLALWALASRRWLAAGIATAAAIASKLSGALLGVAYLIHAALERRLPKGAWLTATIAALGFGPLAIWNASHGWISVRFQLHHGLAGSGGLSSLAEFIAGQCVMGGPVLIVAALVWAARGSNQRLLRAAFTVPLVVFGLAALRSRGEPNWPVMAYVAACVGLSAAGQKWTPYALATGLLISAAGVLHVVHPLVHFGNEAALERLHGSAPLAALGAAHAEVAYAPSYELASELAYYARIPSTVFEPDRPSQFDLWPSPEPKPGNDGLWVCEDDQPVPAALAAGYQRVTGPELLRAELGGRTLHTYRVWRLEHRR